MQMQCTAGCNHGKFYRVQMMQAQSNDGKTTVSREVVSEENCSACRGTGMIDGNSRS